MARVPFIVRDQSLNFVAPGWGMGNRIIPVGCVLNLATELNYRPVVFWPQDEAIGQTRFEDLFESTNLPFELVEGFEAKVMRAVLFGNLRTVSPLKRMGLKPLRFLASLQYDKIIELESMESQLEFRHQIATDLLSFRKIALSTFGFIRYGCDVSWLKPAPHIARRITELKQKFAPNTVGIHIRGTDLRLPIWGNRIPPFDGIVARMRTEIELDPNVKFFIASDGDKYGEVISDLFKDRLIEFKKSATRETVRGQQDAVVDLFGLAATSRIICWRFSTFSNLAAMIGNNPSLRIRSPGSVPNSMTSFKNVN